MDLHSIFLNKSFLFAAIVVNITTIATDVKVKIKKFAPLMRSKNLTEMKEKNQQ